MAITVVHNIGSLVTMSGALQKDGRNLTQDDLSVIPNASLVFENKKAGKIKWVGPKSSLPKEYKKSKKIDAKNRTVIPGFVDSHTHLVFAGDRSQDFEDRLGGASYQEIAKRGGGILTSMKATRESSSKDLLNLAQKRIQNALKQGITTIEIKTGYGLDFKTEKKCLEVIAQLKKTSGATVKSTFLAAHAVPPEFQGRKSDYVIEVIGWLKTLRSKIDFVDMFIDHGYFTVEDAQMLFDEAKRLNIQIKVHADEIELTGGGECAVRNDALSADHLLKISDREISLLAKSQVTCTLLPTTAFFLKESYAPARKLLDSGARVALATDFNPGTSPCHDISLTGLISALQMGMLPHEILAGLTINGAYALGLQKQKGVLHPGYDADFLVIPFQSPSGVFYEFGQRVNSLDVFSQGRHLIKS